MRVGCWEGEVWYGSPTDAPMELQIQTGWLLEMEVKMEMVVEEKELEVGEFDWLRKRYLNTILIIIFC